MTKTLPNLSDPRDITWLRLLLVIIPSGILAMVFLIATVVMFGIWQSVFWIFKVSDGINIFSHRGADNDNK